MLSSGGVHDMSRSRWAGTRPSAGVDSSSTRVVPYPGTYTLIQLAARDSAGLAYVNGLTLLTALTLIFFQCLKRKIPMIWLLYGASALALVLIASLNAAFPLL